MLYSICDSRIANDNGENMVLKPQDIVVLLKLIAKKAHPDWSQNSLAYELCISPSEVNSAFKRLLSSQLITPYEKNLKPMPIMKATEELLIHAVKYLYPAKHGEMTRGIPTSYAAPIFADKVVLGNEPMPVWPHAEGKSRGIGLNPLYISVAESVLKHPDQMFYDLLALADAIRNGRARERAIAVDLLRGLLNEL